MAYIINEQKFIDENVFAYESRLNSSLYRFLDKNPIYVTWYHINTNESTIDEGFRDIESIISGRSPLRFQKIENFPVYGIEQIQMTLDDTDHGLDSNYSGDLVILPNTIKPLQNDFFSLNHVKGNFLFRITEVQYDNIRPDNFYRVSYRFEYLDEERSAQLEKQVHEKFTCILQNIGTENTCLIESADLSQIEAVDNLYNDMVSTYISIFYNERYNCFLGEMLSGHQLFDPLQSVFFNKHKLLNKPNNYSTLVLSEGFLDNHRKIKYEKSIYRIFERRDVKLINQFPYHLIPGTFKKDSSFARWYDNSILIIDLPRIIDKSCAEYFLPNEIVTSFRYNGACESKYVELMQKFIRNEKMSIYDIPLDLNEELLRLDASVEVFLFTPLLLYIIHCIVNGQLQGGNVSDEDDISEINSENAIYAMKKNKCCKTESIIDCP